MITDNLKNKLRICCRKVSKHNKALWYKKVCDMNDKNQLERKIKILVQ